jgi:ribosomal protein S12 methylthiotransferase
LDCGQEGASAFSLLKELRVQRAKKKIGFVSLGCPKNLVDSEVMMGLVAGEGYELTADRDAASVLVVNTCGFIDAAKKESIDTILEMAELKSAGACQKLVVTGCLVERYRDELQREIPEIDAVLGVNELDGIVQAVGPSGPRDLSLPVLPASPPPAALYLYNERTPRILATPAYSAYVKIAEGCDHPCSFCVIPQMRGKFRSRPMGSILREADNLAAKGVKELLLIGQDTTDYGKDLGIKNGLATLLGELDRVEGLGWIRFLYAYPNNVQDAMLDVMAESRQICKYIDIPLQHASSRILKSMLRGGNRFSLTRLISRIRERVPGVTIRTTFIVGFPGETESDFDELLGFVREVEFDNLGVFTYSDEEECGAFALGDKVPSKVARGRQAKLMREQSNIAARKSKEMIGQQVEVLLEGPSRESELLLQGRTQGQAPDIDGCVLINDMAEGLNPQPGDFVRVEITGSAVYDLIGTALSKAAQQGPAGRPSNLRLTDARRN